MLKNTYKLKTTKEDLKKLATSKYYIYGIGQDNEIIVKLKDQYKWKATFKKQYKKAWYIALFMPYYYAFIYETI